MLLTLAWRNLWRNKSRTLIVAASVFFAVILAIFTRSMQEGAYDKMTENAVRFYRGFVQVQQDGYWEEQHIGNSLEITPELKNILASNKDIKAIVPRIESPMMISTGDTTRISLLIGTDPEAENELTSLKEKLVAGEYLNKSDNGVLLAEGLANKLHKSVGDTIVLTGSHYYGGLAYGEFPIMGILKFGNPVQNRQMIYMPVSIAQEMFQLSNRVTSFALDIKNPRASNKVASELSEQVSDEYKVMGWMEMEKELVQMIESDRIGGYFTMGILYIVIGFGIFGTFLMMIAERSYEFGVMTAIGFKRYKLALVVLMEMIFIGLLGVLAGAIVAFPVTLYLHHNPITFTGEMAELYEAFNIEPTFPLSINPSISISQAVVVLIMTALVSIYPISKILKLDAIQAMRD